MAEKGTFEGESGILVKFPGKIVHALGNFVTATTYIAVETYRDFRSPENIDPNIKI